MVATELHFEFYRLPNLYPGHFSTRFGKIAKRGLNLPLSPGVIHTDFHGDVAAKAAELQRTFPEEIWDVKAPTRWEDLLVWFDPYDVHLLGAAFLIQVLYRVFETNAATTNQMLAIIDEAAADWVGRNEPL